MGQTPIIEELTPVEAGAKFLSTLAYYDKVDLRKKFNGALIYGARRSSQLQGNPVPNSIDSLCYRLDQGEEHRALIAGCEVVSKRLEAAKMAFPTIHSIICDNIGKPRPRHVPLPFSDEMLQVIYEQRCKRRELFRKLNGGKVKGRPSKNVAPEFEKGNIHKEFKESLPVLHFALALFAECGRRPDPSFDYVMLGDPDLPRRLYQCSVDLQPVVFQTYNLE